MKKERFDISLFSIIFIGFVIGSLCWQLSKVTGIPFYYPSLGLIVVYVLVYRIYVLFRWSVISTLLLYAVLLIYNNLNHFRDVNDIFLFPFGIFNFVFPLFISAVIVELLIEDDKCINMYYYGRIVFYIFVFTSILTIVSELISPGIARTVFVQNTMHRYQLTFSFAGIYGLSFVIATLVGIRKKIDLYDVLFLTLFIGAVVMSAFLINIIFSAVLVISAVIFRMKPKNIGVYIAILFGVMAIVLINISFLDDILPLLSGSKYSEYTHKAEQISNLMQYKDMSALLSIRSGVYYISIESFIKNALFGSGSWLKVAGHSFILDRLGFIGLFGTLFFVVSIFAISKRSASLLPKDYKGLYRIFIYILFLMLLFNPFDDKEFWLIIFVYIPLIITYYINRANKYDVSFK